MGKILNKETTFIKEVTEDKLDKIENSSYTKFLETSPVIVEYYSQSKVDSTFDEGFENVHSFTGDNSPVKYNKISDLPIYGISQTSLDIDDDELKGMQPVFNTEGVILPNTVEPVANDYFILTYFNKEKYLFKVTSIDIDTIKSNHYYKIQFKFDKKLEDSNIDVNIDEEYTTIFDNIGTNDKSIIRNDRIELIENLYEIYDKLMSEYANFFYNKKVNMMTYKDRDYYIVMPFIDYFLNKHNLYNDRKLPLTLVLDESCKNLYDDFYEEYQKTFYHVLELNDVNQIKNVYISFCTLINRNINSIVYLWNKPYKVMIPISKDYIKYVTCPLIFDKEMIEFIKTKKAINGDDSISIMKNFIINYFVEDTICDMDYFYNIKNKYLNKSIDTFIYTPMVLFIIKKIINNNLINKLDIDGGKKQCLTH